MLEAVSLEAVSTRHHLLEVPKLHSTCLPLRERLAGLKRTITAMANTICVSLMTVYMSPTTAGEARKKLKPAWNKAGAGMLPLALLYSHASTIANTNSSNAKVGKTEKPYVRNLSK
jgi:hypothetical protein